MANKFEKGKIVIKNRPTTRLTEVFNKNFLKIADKGLVGLDAKALEVTENILKIKILVDLINNTTNSIKKNTKGLGKRNYNIKVKNLIKKIHEWPNFSKKYI